MNAISKPSKLRGIPPKAAAPSKPKVVIYGKPGVGKTWAALDFPSVFYIDTEGGADLAHYTDKLEKSGGVYLGPEQGSLDFATVLDQVHALSTEEHGFRTLVIDSITKLFAATIAHEGERLGDKDVWGASKKPAVAYMRRLVTRLTKLDMNVLLIAHESAEWGLNAQGQREQVGVTFDAWEKLEYELHLALHITKEGNSRWAKVRKSRLLGFPDMTRFAWSYDEFAERYGRDVIEGASVPLVFAEPAVVDEIQRLLAIVKLPDGWVDKVLTAAGASSFAELTAEQANKSLAYLNDKITKGTV
jgi:hypothetical protein